MDFHRPHSVHALVASLALALPGLGLPVAGAPGLGAAVPAAAAAEPVRDGDVLGFGDLTGILAARSGRHAEADVLPVPDTVAVRALSAGIGHVLVVTGAGAVLQLGEHRRPDRAVAPAGPPTTLPLPTGTRVVSVSSRSDHSMLLTDDGRLFGVGRNAEGQLGDGTTRDSDRPVRVALPAGVRVRAVAVGVQRTVAATSTGGLLQWGDGTPVPTAVPLPHGAEVVRVATGDRHSLAVTSRGELLSWGEDSEGKLGRTRETGRTTQPGVAPLPPGVRASDVAVVERASLVLTASGGVLSAGDGSNGQTGTGGGSPDRPSFQPVPLPGGSRVDRLIAAGPHAVARTTDRRLITWGSDRSGETGVRPDDLRPAVVTLPPGAGARALVATAPRTTVLVAAAAPVLTAVSPTSGPASGGTALTVTGEGLFRVTRVTVGGRPATGLRCVPTRCTATAPAGDPGPADVVVANDVGTSGTQRFTYDAADPARRAPAAPTGVTAAAAPAAADVTWTPPVDQGTAAVSRWTVTAQHLPAPGDDAARPPVSVTVDTPAAGTTPLSVRLEGLEPGQRYGVTVVAHSDHGVSSPSDPVEVVAGRRPVAGLTLEVLSRTITAGNAPEVRGAAVDAQGRPVAGATVRITAQAYGETAYRTIGTAVTDEAGAYRTRITPLVQSRTGAEVDEAGGPVAAPRSVLVQVHARMGLRPAGPTATVLSGRMVPGYAGVAVGLAELAGGRFRVLTQVLTDASGTWSVRVPSLSGGSHVLVVFTSAHRGTSAGANSTTISR